MKRAVLNERRSRRRKWLRRAVLLVLLAAVLLLAVPFAFPGAAVRYWLAHCGWRDMPVRFRAARLWPTGRLTLYDVEVEDGDAPGGRWKLSAGKAEVDFHWTDLAAQHLETLVLENLELALKPEAEVAGKLLGLGTRGVSCEQIIATGNVRLTGEAPWMKLLPVQRNEAVAMQLVVKSTANATGASEDVSLILGTEASAERPFLMTRFAVQGGGRATTIKVEGLNIGNLTPEVTEGLWQAWPELAGVLRGPARGRLERLLVSGNIALGRETMINVTGEVRDMDLRLNAWGQPAEVEHLSVAAHIEGNLTAGRLKGLKLARAHCSWEKLGAADWMLSRGTADWEVDGSDIVLSEMKSQLGAAQVEATGAFDTAAGLLARGRAWIRDMPASELRAQLPEGIRGALPDAFVGMLSARVFLAESDSDHLSAYVECGAPGYLTLHMPAGALETESGSIIAPATTVGTRPDLPRAVLSNGLISGTVTWNFRGGPALEVSHGRFTADELYVVPPWASGLTEGTSLNRIKSDFEIAGGMVRLDDFYADLAGNGRLSAEGSYTQQDGALQDVAVNLSGVDLALADPWLPPGWSLTGQVDADWRGTLSPKAATAAMSIGLGGQAALRGPDCRVAVTGSPAVVAATAALDRRTGVVQVLSGELTGLGVIQADAGWVARLRREIKPTPGDTWALLLDRAEMGAFASLDKVSFTGRLGSNDATGTVSLSGLDLGAGSARGTSSVDEDRPTVLNLSLKADVSIGLREAATLNVKEGQFLAERVTLGQYVFTGISGNLAVEKGQIAVTQGALSAAEGTMSGDATLSTAGRLETLHLGFDDVAQQALLRHLYPELFSAEGLVSGKLTLAHAPGNLGDLTGSIELTANRPGRLKLSPQAAQVYARQTAAPGVIAQLADYPYAMGKATLQDEVSGGTNGLRITVDYPRQTGDAGAAQGTYQFKDTVRVDGAVVQILEEFLGMHQASGAATRPVP